LSKINKQKRILILEDEKVLADVYRKQLEKAGYAVRCAEEGKAGLTIAESFHPELILLDQSLKGDAPGTELVSFFQKTVPEAKLVMLSNYSSFQMKERAVAAGALDYWIKIDTPPDALLVKIKSLLE
jgi:CheY-like chemotaxis protein